MSSQKLLISLVLALLLLLLLLFQSSTKSTCKEEGYLERKSEGNLEGNLEGKGVGKLEGNFEGKAIGKVEGNGEIRLELPEKEILMGQRLAHCRNEVLVKKKWAFSSLVYSNNEYLVGLGALIKSFKEYSEIDPEEVQLILQVAYEIVTPESIEILQGQGWEICEVDLIPGKKRQGFAQERFRHAYTKLWAFSWVPFQRVVYMDGDFLIIRSIRDLFTEKTVFGAVQGFWGKVFTPHFNGGMFSVRPSEELFEGLMTGMNTLTFNENLADQALMNAFFELQPHTRLPFSLNAGGALAFEMGFQLWRTHEKKFDGGFSAIHYTSHKPFDLVPWVMPGRDELLTIWRTRTKPVPLNSTAILLFHCEHLFPVLRSFVVDFDAWWDSDSPLHFHYFTNAEVPVDQIWIKLTKKECPKTERIIANAFHRHRVVLQQFQYVYAMNPTPLHKRLGPRESLETLGPLVWVSRDLYGGRPDLLLDLWRQVGTGESANMEEAFRKHPEATFTPL